MDLEHEHNYAIIYMIGSATNGGHYKLGLYFCLL